MKNKWIAIIAVILGYVLNLVDVSIGSKATIYNFLVTLGYVIFWLLYLRYNRDNKKNLKLSSIVSGVTFICCFIITIVNITDFTIKYWNTIYILTSLATPFYGVRFFINNMTWCVGIITLITGLWFGVSTYFYRKIK